MRPCVLSIVCYLFSCQVLFLVMTRFLRTFLCVKQKVDHRGIRTTNLLIPSQTLYPLGHAAICPVNCICYLFSCQVLSLIFTSFVRTFFCVKQNVEHRGIGTPNLLIRSQTPYPRCAMRPSILSIVCYSFSCQVLSLVLTPFLRNFLCVKQKLDHRGIRTPNLLIRSQTPYPLGHAAMCSVNCICCLFSCQMLFLVMTRFLRTFLCVKQKVDHREIRTTNLLIPSQTLYPLSHAAMCTVNCMLLIQLPSVVPCVDSISKKFPLCQAKSRPQRDSNPQSSDSKSDALPPLCNAAMYPVNCMLLIQLPSVVPCVDSISKKFPLCQTKSRP